MLNNSHIGKIQQKRLLDSLDAYEIYPHNSSILVGISGGPDSVYLAYLLHTLDFRISLAHVNYGLRNKDSEYEEELVRNYADKWNARIYVHKENPKTRMLDSGESLQQIARQIRYDFYEECMNFGPHSHCLLAHHQDDQIESILLSFIKGNNSRVLHGMPKKRGKYIRPILDFTKEEILEGLKEAGLEYSLDISNDSNDYMRNKIRNQLIPLLEEINPAIKTQILHKEELYKEQKRALSQQLYELSMHRVHMQPKGMKYIDLSGLEETEGLMRAFVTSLLEGYGLHGYLLWQAVDLLNSPSGKFVEYEHGRIYRERGGLSKINHSHPSDREISEGEAEFCVFEYEGFVFELSTVSEADFSKENTYYLNKDKLRFPLRFRHPKEGEKMKPLGMRQSKKLSDIMIDEKWTQIAKKVATLIEDQEKICALVNFRISEEIKLKKDTKNILQISFRHYLISNKETLS